MHWIDSHIHLSSYQPVDLDLLIKKSTTQNINAWVMAGYNSQDWHRQVAMSQSSLFKSFGLHPWQVLASTDSEITQELITLENLISQADALGETGLDGFRGKTTEEMARQLRVFQRHLELNKIHSKPLVLHIVKAHEMALAELKKHSYVGLVHGFSGSWETAKNYIDLGYKISVGRGVYHKGYNALKEAVKKLPLEALLIESDAFSDSKDGPEDAVEIYLAVVEAVCSLKNISQQQLQEAVFHNINSLFTKE